MKKNLLKFIFETNSINSLKPLLLIIICLLSFCLTAQRFNLAFNHLSRETGLSNNNASALLVDSKGFAWFGTQNGLNRFDGSSCKVYKPYNSSIKGSNISDLIEDKNTDIWFSSETGLNHYSRLQDSFDNFECIKDGKSRRHTPFYVDNLNRIWLIIEGKGIYVYNPANKGLKFIVKNASFFSKVCEKPFQNVQHIYNADDSFGLHYFTLKDDKVINSEVFFTGKKQPSINCATYFYPQNDSLIWLTNHDKGLIKFNLKSKTIRIFNSFEDSPLTKLTEISFRPQFQQLYVGSTDMGLLVFDTKKEQFVKNYRHNPSNPQSLKADWVEDVLIDKHDNLLVGLMGWGVDFTNQSGVNVEHWLNKEEVKKYNLPSNEITSFWISKRKALLKINHKYQNHTVVILDTQGNFIEKRENFPAAAGFNLSQNGILMACGVGEVYILDDDFNITKRIAIGVNGKREGLIYAITDIAPNEWIVNGASSFYQVLKKGSKFIVSEIPSLRKNILAFSNPLYFDKRTQQLFISSVWWNHFNILKKKNNQWVLQSLKKLPANVFSIVPDSTQPNKLWLCTNKGLVKFDVDTYQYTVWDEAKGLPDNAVTTYIPEPRGDFWLITNRGISFYNNRLKSFRNFTVKDGATSPEYDWWGNFQLPDGRMFFPGLDGITVIDPNKMNVELPPVVQITDLKVNEKSVPLKQSITESNTIELQSNQNSFSVDFVGIDYNHPTDVKLRYKLDGLDKEWANVKNPATTHFLNVPEGDYTLKIQSISETGKVYSDKKLRIYVAGPFWNTWWFKVFILATLLGIFYGFYRYRLNQILKLQAVRNGISSDLHDEIGTTLSGIGIMSTIAKQQIHQGSPVYPLLERISEDTLSMGNAIDDIVWSINPNNDDISNIIARMSRHAAELFDVKGIDYQLKMPSKVESIKLSMEQRRDVYLIFKESVSNLIKYANCKNAIIEVKIEDRHFMLLVMDDGVGFDPQKLTNRNGISNMKNRAKKLNGKLTVKSELGRGTTVRLDFDV
jgi:two-component sensor histidine kinase/streptogramin lyase